MFLTFPMRPGAQSGTISTTPKQVRSGTLASVFASVRSLAMIRRSLLTLAAELLEALHRHLASFVVSGPLDERRGLSAEITRTVPEGGH